jgi:hypothetical protein
MFNRAAVHIIQANFAPLQSPTHQSDSIIRIGLIQNIADVVVHSSLADVQVLGNLFICQSFSYQFQDLKFSFREGFRGLVRIGRLNMHSEANGEVPPILQNISRNTRWSCVNEKLAPEPRSSVLSETVNAIFLGSSVVERSTVNRLVVGSNPTRGANFYD